MITVTIELNRVKVTRELPTQWKEVTFKQFLELNECRGDYVKVLSLFTGIDQDTVRKCKIWDLDAVLVSLTFLHSKPENVIPEKLLTYEIPKDLGLEFIGQYEDLKDELQNQQGLTNRQKLEKYTLYCAVYACRAKFGDYDWMKAVSMQDEFLEAPAVEVLGVGNFTLLKLIGLTRHIKEDSPKAKPLKTKFRLALQSFRFRWDFEVQSIILKIKRLIPKIRSSSGQSTGLTEGFKTTPTKSE